jgi:hypothetical protein
MLQCGLLRSNFSLAIAFCSSVEFVNPANSKLGFTFRPSVS